MLANPTWVYSNWSYHSTKGSIILEVVFCKCKMIFAFVHTTLIDWHFCLWRQEVTMSLQLIIAWSQFSHVMEMFETFWNQAFWLRYHILTDHLVTDEYRKNYSLSTDDYNLFLIIYLHDIISLWYPIAALEWTDYLAKTQ